MVTALQALNFAFGLEPEQAEALDRTGNHPGFFTSIEKETEKAFNLLIFGIVVTALSRTNRNPISDESLVASLTGEIAGIVIICITASKLCSIVKRLQKELNARNIHHLR